MSGRIVELSVRCPYRKETNVRIADTVIGTAISEYAGSIALARKDDPEAALPEAPDTLSPGAVACAIRIAAGDCGFWTVTYQNAPSKPKNPPNQPRAEGGQATGVVGVELGETDFL